MPCDSSSRNGDILWMCGSEPAPKCSACRRRKATLLCDYAGPEGACDAPLCSRCAVHLGTVDARPDLTDGIVRLAIQRTFRPRKVYTLRESAQRARTDPAMRDLAEAHMQPDTVDWCPSHPVPSPTDRVRV